MPYETVRRLVVSIVLRFMDGAYLQEAFGYDCVDEGKVSGTVGPDVESFFLLTLRRDDVWPFTYDVGISVLDDRWTTWERDTLFDVLEVLYDLVSKPLQGRYHDYSNCGWHYAIFDRDAGRDEFRKELNVVLVLGEPAYELTVEGEVVEATPDEFRPLLTAPIPDGAEEDLITAKVDRAVARFRSRSASVEDRQHAVRDLADVLELLRQDVKAEFLPADENALYNIINGFNIRHHSRSQKIDYERTTWLRWMFYVYLATIHAVLRVRARTTE